jgi:ATP-dependent Clp protease, protease subunit
MSIEELEERILILNEDVSEYNTGNLIGKIIKINQKDYIKEKEIIGFKREPIKLYINTNGGTVYDGFGLVGVIENSKTPIHTIVLGKAMSFGLPILLAGHKRYAYKYSTIMFHEVIHSINDKLTGLTNIIEEDNRLQKLMEQMILEKTNITQEKMDSIKKQKKDWYISAEEALELGVVNEIIK